MTKRTKPTNLTRSIFLMALALGSAAFGKPIPANGKLKIFILSGQSNMIGFGQLREGHQDYHWLRNWETLYLIGKSMGDAMLGLESGNTTTSKVKGLHTKSNFLMSVSSA